VRCLGPATMWSTRDAVPRLPLPTLSSTLSGYLEAVQPFLSPQLFLATQAAVEDFAMLEGPRLHADLARLDAESPTSWIEGFWDAMYLEARSSVAVDWNPSFVLRPEEGVKLTQTQRAARLAHEALHVHRAIATQTFPPDMEGSAPLHMRQHVGLFGSARIPRVGRDELVGPSGATHIAVLCRGHIFAVEALEPGSLHPLSEATLAARFAHVQREAQSGSSGPSLGLLCALERDEWAKLRESMVKDPRAQRVLTLVDSALFVVALDEVEPGDSLDATAKQMLIGRDCERWWDKWLFAVTPNAQAGFNLEHSPHDGHTFVSMFNYMAAIRRPPQFGKEANIDGAAGVVRLDPGPLLREVSKGLDKGRAYLAAKDKQLSLSCLEVAWGTDVIKTLRSSPDAFMQLAFQLAYARIHQRVGVTYESGNVKRFLAGRTETIRPVTAESVAFALNWDRADGAKKRELYDRAATKHVERVTAAKTGRGWDRHLFALRQLARHKQQRMPNHAFSFPAIFTDPTFAKYFNIEVSTSNSGALPFQVFSFAPVIADGIGIGYQTFNKSLSVCTTSYSAPAENFTRQLRDAVDSLREHLSKN
jgi:carnitine O-acetyltransferase